jgi:hypothetical protein
MIKLLTTCMQSSISNQELLEFISIIGVVIVSKGLLLSSTEFYQDQFNFSMTKFSILPSMSQVLHMIRSSKNFQPNIISWQL